MWGWEEHRIVGKSVLAIVMGLAVAGLILLANSGFDTLPGLLKFLTGILLIAADIVIIRRIVRSER